MKNHKYSLQLYENGSGGIVGDTTNSIKDARSQASYIIRKIATEKSSTGAYAYKSDTVLEIYNHKDDKTVEKFKVTNYRK